MSVKKTIAFLLILVILLFIGYRFFDQQFRLGNILSTKAMNEDSPQPIPEPIVQILSQPFYYLDRGKQSFVFSSQDGLYVLKFFDTRCLRSGAIPFIAPISAKRCEKKMKGALNGYHLAWDHDRETTGLLFVQLSSNPADTLHVTVKDRFGFQHNIPLAHVPFVLQVHAVPTRQVITALLNKGDISEAKRRLQQLIAMYLKEYQQGIVDGDHNVMYNTGFVGETPVRLDPGRLHKDSSMVDPHQYQQDLDKVFVGRVGEWLSRHFPQYQKELMDK